MGKTAPADRADFQVVEEHFHFARPGVQVQHEPVDVRVRDVGVVFQFEPQRLLLGLKQVAGPLEHELLPAPGRGLVRIELDEPGDGLIDLLRIPNLREDDPGEELDAGLVRVDPELGRRVLVQEDGRGGIVVVSVVGVVLARGQVQLDVFRRGQAAGPFAGEFVDLDLGPDVVLSLDELGGLVREGIFVEFLGRRRCGQEEGGPEDEDRSTGGVPATHRAGSWHPRRART